jgi:hypothetical protein
MLTNAGHSIRYWLGVVLGQPFDTMVAVRDDAGEPVSKRIAAQMILGVRR